MKIFLVCLVALMAILLWRPGMGFRAQRMKDYAGSEPAFDIRARLNGPIKSEGVIYGPTGRVVSQFTADMNGVWDGASGTLSEDFAYSSGGTQARKWFLKLGNDGRFTATADDIIGKAEGEISGSTVRLKYKLRLPEDAGGHTLNVTDWMYLAENGNIINRSEMRKFGIKVAELVASMRPITTPAE